MSLADGVGSAQIDDAVSAKQITKAEWRIELLSFRAESRLQRSGQSPRGQAFNRVAKAFK